MLDAAFGVGDFFPMPSFLQYSIRRCSNRLAWLRCEAAAAFSSRDLTSGENRNDTGDVAGMYCMLHYTPQKIKLP